MSPKDIRFGSGVIQRLIKGVNTLADAVGSTMGPGGRNVIFKNYGWPLVTKDGVTVARQIELPDEFENIGAQMVKQVANRTCKDAGDGTTTATVLAQCILNNGFKHLIAGVNPIDLQRSINKSVDAIIDYIREEIREEIGNDKERIRQIANVSANWDSEIGDIVGEAVSAVGLDGAVIVEDTLGYETSLNIVSGIKFDRGFGGTSPYFVNNQSKNNVEMKNPYIFLYRGTLNNTRNLFPLLEKLSKADNGGPAEFVIIADGYEPEVLSTLIANKNLGRLKPAVIKAPHFGDFRIDTMNDLALLFNTVYFDENFGNTPLTQVTLDMLGHCEKVIINEKNCSFIGFKASPDAIQERIKEVKERKNDRDLDDITIANIDKRVAQLNGYVATISIGGSTDVEVNEKHDRADDALHATQAAVEEGIVPGGSYSYITAASRSKKFRELLDSTDDITRAGAQIVRLALEGHFKRLLLNAGKVDSMSSILETIKNTETPGYGYNVKTDKFENLLESGVVDPFKVTRSALQNAASVAGLMLTSEVVIGDIVANSNEKTQNSDIPSLF
ncbi:MAG: molecular chaperone GroEL [Clostridia bacterium]|nr:molecular chaperone GroEL [Clostridia bacterium]